MPTVGLCVPSDKRQPHLYWAAVYLARLTTCVAPRRRRSYLLFTTLEFCGWRNRRERAGRPA